MSTNSNTAQSQSTSPPLHTGWLKRKGEGLLPFQRQWSRYSYILRVDGRLELRSSSSTAAALALLIISLHGATITVINNNKHPDYFEITTTSDSKIVRLQADSSFALLEFVDAVERARRHGILRNVIVKRGSLAVRERELRAIASPLTTPAPIRLSARMSTSEEIGGNATTNVVSAIQFNDNDSVDDEEETAALPSIALTSTLLSSSSVGHAAKPPPVPPPPRVTVNKSKSLTPTSPQSPLSSPSSTISSIHVNVASPPSSSSQPPTPNHHTASLLTPQHPQTASPLTRAAINPLSVATDIPATHFSPNASGLSVSSSPSLSLVHSRVVSPPFVPVTHISSLEGTDALSQRPIHFSDTPTSSGRTVQAHMQTPSLWLSPDASSPIGDSLFIPNSGGGHSLPNNNNNETPSVASTTPPRFLLSPPPVIEDAVADWGGGDDVGDDASSIQRNDFDDGICLPLDNEDILISNDETDLTIKVPFTSASDSASESPDLQSQLLLKDPVVDMNVHQQQVAEPFEGFLDMNVRQQQVAEPFEGFVTLPPLSPAIAALNYSNSPPSVSAAVGHARLIPLPLSVSVTPLLHTRTPSPSLPIVNDVYSLNELEDMFFSLDEFAALWDEGTSTVEADFEGGVKTPIFVPSTAVSIRPSPTYVMLSKQQPPLSSPPSLLSASMIKRHENLVRDTTLTNNWQGNELLRVLAARTTLLSPPLMQQRRPPTVPVTVIVPVLQPPPPQQRAVSVGATNAHRLWSASAANNSQANFRPARSSSARQRVATSKQSILVAGGGAGPSPAMKRERGINI